MNRLLPQTLPTARDMLAQVVLPTLHRQRWSLDGAAAAHLGRIVHLSAGRAELGHDDGELVLRGAEIAWLPAGTARHLRVDPGSAGTVIGVSDAMLAAAIGQHAESGGLRQLTGQLSRLSAHEAGPREELNRSLAALAAETRSTGGGAWHYLSAHLTIVLVLMWRIAAREPSHTLAGPPREPRLQRFRHLVEARFREHWTIGRYAAELSLTADRLHDLCLRHLGRTPLALLHQRLVHEACLLLSGSAQPIERLAGDLGFASASHFSRFFKRHLGLGPKAWREQSRAKAAAGLPALPASYADWP
jgi:AraC family transcriptional regulator, transcriptional activator of pobA